MGASRSVSCSGRVSPVRQIRQYATCERSKQPQWTDCERPPGHSQCPRLAVVAQSYLEPEEKCDEMRGGEGSVAWQSSVLPSEEPGKVPVLHLSRVERQSCFPRHHKKRLCFPERKSSLGKRRFDRSSGFSEENLYIRKCHIPSLLCYGNGIVIPDTITSVTDCYREEAESVPGSVGAGARHISPISDEILPETAGKPGFYPGINEPIRKVN